MQATLLFRIIVAASITIQCPQITASEERGRPEAESNPHLETVPQVHQASVVTTHKDRIANIISFAYTISIFNGIKLQL